MIGKRERLQIQQQELETQRSTYLTLYRDLADFILPRRIRLTLSDVNKGDRRNQKIIDSTGTLAMRTLRSGMMSGITSPARPWFRNTTADPELAEYGPVKNWLYTVDERMRWVLLRSNAYNALHVCYGDIGTFAIHAMVMEPDFENVVRFYPMPIGTYCVANNEKRKVDVFTRSFPMTVRNVVNTFGKTDERTGKADWSSISNFVKDLYDKGNYQTWINICHAIQPNDEYDQDRISAKYKKYASCYYEDGAQGTNNYMGHPDERMKMLRESGYDNFPVLAPRWEAAGEDAYGSDCPGITALGDIKALQIMQKRKAQAIEKMVNPAMTGPTTLKTQRVSLLAGDITFADEREGMKGFRPVHEVDPRIQEMLLDIQDHQQRIRRACFEDLFLMLASDDRKDVTATEIVERKEEKLLALGPVLEQLNQDLLDPLIDNLFEIMLKRGMIPPPPQELKGQKLKTEYVSVMAQAQKLVGIGGIERLYSFAGSIAAMSPTAAAAVERKLDIEQSIDVYADIVSVPPGIVRPDEEVKKIQAAQDQAMQAQQNAEVANQAAGAAKTLSETQLGGDSALNQMIQNATAGSLVPASA